MTNAAERVTINDQGEDRDEKDMDIVYITDRGGNPIRMQMFEGKPYVPLYRPSDMRGIRTFELRNDDIYFPAYPRTGTHWTFEMISMLLKGTAETIPFAKASHQLEVAKAESLAALSSPRVLNTHMRLSDGPEQLAEKKCKIIYNLRDPKDAAVSLYSLHIDLPDLYDYHGEFKDYLYLFLEEKGHTISTFIIRS